VRAQVDCLYAVLSAARCSRFRKDMLATSQSDAAYRSEPPADGFPWTISVKFAAVCASSDFVGVKGFLK